MKKLTLFLLVIMSSMSFANNHSSNKSNILIEKDKFEVVIIDGVETIFETSTLKPVMIFEEVVKITNISEGHLKSVIYDAKLDYQSALFTPSFKDDDVEVLYSNDDGETFSTYPILVEGLAIDLDDYTDIRMNISKLMFGESKTVKFRYSYDHFKQG